MRRGLLGDELDWYHEDVGGDEEPGWLSVSASPDRPRPGLLDAAGELQSLDIQDRWNPWESPLENFQLEAATDGLDARIPPRKDMYPSHYLHLWSDGLLEFGHLLVPELRQPDHARVMPRLPVAHYIHDYLALFAAVYRNARYAGRVMARVAFDNVCGYSLGVERVGTTRPRLADTHVETTWSGESAALEGEAGLIAKSALDRVWRSAGVERGCPFVDAAGNLTRR